MDIVFVIVLVKEEIRSILLIVSGCKLDDDNDDLKLLIVIDIWKKILVLICMIIWYLYIYVFKYWGNLYLDVFLINYLILILISVVLWITVFVVNVYKCGFFNIF